MIRSSRDLSAPEWSHQLGGLIERASLSIGRLDARISASPVRQAWIERASWSGFAKARQGQGAEIDEIDVFALVSGVALPARRPIAFAAEEVEALAAWQRKLGSREARHWRELAPYPLDLPEEWRERSALLRVLELIGRHARDDSSHAPWLTGPFLFASLKLSDRTLPCLVVVDKALRHAPYDREAIVPRFLKEVARLADAGRMRLEAMEADRLRAAVAIQATARPAGLIGLTALLQRRPLISPLRVAEALRMTISGAGKLLMRAANAGLLVEISGRQAWKLYLPPDLAMTFGYIPRPVGRPAALPAAEPLDPILRRFDAEMAAIDARLAQLGVQTWSDDSRMDHSDR